MLLWSAISNAIARSDLIYVTKNKTMKVVEVYKPFIVVVTVMKTIPSHHCYQNPP